MEHGDFSSNPWFYASLRLIWRVLAACVSLPSKRYANAASKLQFAVSQTHNSLLFIGVRL